MLVLLHSREAHNLRLAVVLPQNSAQKEWQGRGGSLHIGFRPVVEADGGVRLNG